MYLYVDEAVTRNLTKLQTSYVNLLQVMLYNLIQEFTQHQLVSGYLMAVAQCILVNQRIYYEYILLLEIQLSREDGSDLLDQLTLYCLSLTISDFDSSIFFCV
jgi:hypothetical protein